MITAGSIYLLLAFIGRFIEAVGAATCPCAADCWCQKPGLSTFRWVAPFGHRLMTHLNEDPAV